MNRILRNFIFKIWLDTPKYAKMDAKLAKFVTQLTIFVAILATFGGLHKILKIQVLKIQFIALMNLAVDHAALEVGLAPAAEALLHAPVLLHELPV